MSFKVSPNFFATVGLLTGLMAIAQPASAVFLDPNDPNLNIPTQLLAFGPIQGDAFLPLTTAANSSTDPNAPAAVPDAFNGYGWVKSHIAITLSSQRPTPGPASTGEATLGVPYNFNDTGATDGPTGASCDGHGASGNVGQGDSVCVNSFFDVYFDVAISNTDTTGAQFFAGFGPQLLTAVDIHTPYPLQQNSVCIADLSQPNLGCLPPVGSAYIGHFIVSLPLVDINGNGAIDKLKFDLVQHDVGGVTNTFVNASTVTDTFNSTLVNNGGGVYDDVADPPFGPITLTGPTTAQQVIVFNNVPEPDSLALSGIGLSVLLGMSLRNRRPSRLA